VVSDGSVDLKSAHVLDDGVGKYFQGFDVFAFGLVLIAEELDLNKGKITIEN
jgi:hypothetical protein